MLQNTNKRTKITLLFVVQRMRGNGEREKRTKSPHLLRAVDAGLQGVLTQGAVSRQDCQSPFHPGLTLCAEVLELIALAQLSPHVLFDRVSAEGLLVRHWFVLNYYVTRNDSIQ